MYQGRFENATPERKPRRGTKRLSTLLLSVILVVTIAVGGTVAYLVTQDKPITNTFTPSHVTCRVDENFDGKTKTNVNVTNTGDTEAYIRVKLVTYRVNAAGQHIGGTATIPAFNPGTHWVKHNDGYYYYTLPVKPNEQPTSDLIGSITLESPYTDADGGKQVIEVMAEAIQSAPAEAIGQSWGVTISEGSVTPYSAT